MGPIGKNIDGKARPGCLKSDRVIRHCKWGISTNSAQNVANREAKDASPQGNAWRPWREVRTPWGPGIQPVATWARGIPAKWLYNPLVPEYDIFSICTDRRDGRMNTHGVGSHPDDGALQPQGALAYHRPLCTPRRRRWWISRAWALHPAPVTGTCTPGVPIYNTFGCEIWNSGTSYQEHCMVRKTGTGRHGGRMARTRLTPYQKHCNDMVKENKPLIEARFAKPTVLWGNGKNHRSARIALRCLGSKGPHGIRSAVNARAQSVLNPPDGPVRYP